MILIANGVSSTEILESYGCANVSGLHKINGILVVGMHLEQT